MDEIEPTIRNEIARLQRMTVPQLKARYSEVFGRPAMTDHPQMLRRLIAYRLQEQAYGGLPDELRQYAIALAKTLPVRKRIAAKPLSEGQGRSVSTKLLSEHDSRLPMPGSFLVKEYRGRRIVVRVLDTGFECDGRKFSSLSAVATAIAGTKWNGFLFFGLMKEAESGRP